MRRVIMLNTDKIKQYRTNTLLSIGCLLFLVVSGCSIAPKTHKTLSELVDMVCCEKKIGPEERVEYEKRALAGDLDAANKVVDYYMRTFKTSKQVPQILVWQTVAMSDGNETDKISLAGTFTGLNLPYTVTPQSCKYGHQLLEDGKRKGYEGAIILLSMLTPDCGLTNHKIRLKDEGSIETTKTRHR